MEEQHDIQSETEIIKQHDVQPPKQQPAIGYGGQFAILIGFVGVGLILAAVTMAFLWMALTHTSITTMETSMSNPAYAKPLQIIQVVASVCMLFFPAVAFAVVVSRKPFGYLGFGTRFSAKQIFLVILIALAGFLISGPMGIINEAIPIPKSWQLYFHQKEEDYSDAVQAMATMKTFAEYLIALFVIALTPAIIEESFFRGALQQLFIKWFKRVGIAIVAASVIFSIFHASYYGFLPRAALGIILGFIFYYGKNIWLNALAHFINNGIAITQLYILTKSGKSVKEIMKDDSLPFVSGHATTVAAIVMLVVGIYIMKLLFKALKNESERIGADKIDTAVRLNNNNPFEE